MRFIILIPISFLLIISILYFNFVLIPSFKDEYRLCLVGDITYTDVCVNNKRDQNFLFKLVYDANLLD